MLLGLGRVLRPAVLRLAGTSITAVTAVPFDGDLQPVLKFYILPLQGKPSPMGASVAVFFCVLLYILDITDLFSERISAILVIIGGLKKTGLPGGIQAETDIQTLIPRVIHHLFIPGMILLHLT